MSRPESLPRSPAPRTSAGAAVSAEDIARFKKLQERLPVIWHAVEGDQPWAHTSVVVPSLSFDQEELSKISGAPFYEERLLFILIRLRHPLARVVYVTSQPVDPNIVDYYLQHLVGVPVGHARSRLQMLCVHDASPRSLAEKILERPRVIERIRRWVGDRSRAYLTCFNSSFRERQLTLALGIPLNGLDPDLLPLGTKTGSRRVFARAGIEYPLGREDLHGEDEVLDGLVEIAEQRPGIEKAVVKLNESFAGTGNALFRFPAELPTEPTARRSALAEALRHLDYEAAEETYEAFFRKMGSMGGIVEEFVTAAEARSPSVQMRINPDGSIQLISSHDQVLGGTTGQSYQGCRFPAADEYRDLIQRQGFAVAEVLATEGVVSRFGIDFLVTRDGPGQPWRSVAIEINLRMGGTTPPFLALQFLTGGELDVTTGHFLSGEGKPKYYRATDNLHSPAYRGLLPEDLIDILTLHRLHFKPSTESGVLFHMIGALSQYGKVGVTCIGSSPEEAEELYQRTREILDLETAGATEGAESYPLYEKGLSPME